MSTILNTNGAATPVPAPLNPDFRCVVIAATWNPDITDTLLHGATETLQLAGVGTENISQIRVPGTVELTFAAAEASRCLRPDAIIVIGCVIRGDTAHFDYVCQSVTQGISMLNASGSVPVIFGVLTVDNMQQALDRAGGCLGNKGSEAAVAAIEMANLACTLRKS